MKAVDIFEKVRKRENIELEDIYFLVDKFNVEEGKITRLIGEVENRIITPREAVEILKDKRGAVVLENHP